MQNAARDHLALLPPAVTPNAPEGPSRERKGDRGGTPSALTAYLQSTRRYALMSREEEHQVALRFEKTRDKTLGQRLVNANLRLVVKIALEYRAARSKLLDLVQEGNLGLLHALQKYEPRRGWKLATYASWWIRAYILRFIMSDTRLLKLGTTQTQRRLFYSLRRTRAHLESLTGAEVDSAQLAKALSVSAREVEEMEARLAFKEAPLEARPRDGESIGQGLRADTVGPDIQAEAAQLRELLNRELGVFRRTLEGRELVLFQKRLLSEDGVTLAVLGGEFGVSRERVRQLEDRLKARLREHLRTTMGDAVPREPATTSRTAESPELASD
jgi:RNA polymerase sigma-32 factor